MDLGVAGVGAGGGSLLPQLYAQVNSLIGISRGLPGVLILLATSKEEHSLTRKLVEYRNWRQWWERKNQTKIIYIALLWFSYIYTC